MDFRCQLSKTQMFALEQKTNYKPIKNGLFINCNHTALHACWFLQDLLDYFLIDKSTVSFLIRRPSGAEPKKVKEYVESRFKRNFTEYLIARHRKTNEYANKVIHTLEKYLNPMLLKISKSYTNLFLFDDNQILYNYIKKLRETIDCSLKFDANAKKILNKYLDYLVQYYKEN